MKEKLQKINGFIDVVVIIVCAIVAVYLLVKGIPFILASINGVV